MSVEKMWFVYIIQTACGKLYTGISTDIERRFNEHLEVHQGRGIKGAKFFRGHKPQDILYRETYQNRSEASKRERQIKLMTVTQKKRLIALK